MIRFLLLLLLTVCTGAAYEPPHGTYLIHINSTEHVRALYERAGGKERDIGGFAFPETDPCQIFIAARYFDYLIHHELKNCNEEDRK